MKYVVTGAGQIGTELVRSLLTDGHEVTVARRARAQVPGATTIAGDAGDRATLTQAAAGASAIFHCIHAPYDRRAWRTELPSREQAVMDVAAVAGIPVVFPESVYAFGHQTCELHEGAPIAPCTGLGEVRADLLAARIAHPADTLSIVASDVFGPTAGVGSVATALVIRPVLAGRRAYIPADLDAPHTWTYLPDLAAAMVTAARDASSFTPGGHALLHAPSAAPRSLREVAHDVAEAAGIASPRITRIPEWPLALMGPLARQVREVHEQAHLRRDPLVLHPGVLAERGVAPTPWASAVAETVRAAST